MPSFVSASQKSALLNIMKAKVASSYAANLVVNLVGMVDPTKVPPPPDPDDVAEVFAKLFEVLGAGTAAGTISSSFVTAVAGKEFDTAVNEYYSSLLHMLTYPIILKLKTLPMLSLSSPSCLFKRVVVLINTNSGIGARPKLDGWNRVMSGVYFVLGFKHVFSAKDAYSQFILVREPFNFADYIFDSDSL